MSRRTSGRCQRSFRSAVTALTIAVVGLVGLAIPAHAAPSDVSVLDVSGSTSHVIDLLYVAEGYAAADKDQSLQDAKTVHLGLVGSPPFAQMRPLLSARALFVPSNERGSDHPSKNEEHDTAFDSTYDSNGVGRLITANNGAVQIAANAAFPAYDLAILIVNDQRYGGSGGGVPMVSMHPSSIAVLQHEIAHNLAGLADEYTAPYPGYPAGDSEPNVASKAHLSPLPWQVWVTPNTPIPTPASAGVGPHTPIGAYEGARYQSKDMFRPAPNCKMRNLSATFCPVCAEALLLAVAGETTMLRGHVPEPKLVDCDRGACPVFSVATAELTTESVAWSLDGAPVGTGATWSPTANLVGTHVVRATVRDTTALVLADPSDALVETWQWQLQIRAVDAGASADSSEFDAGTQPPIDGSTSSPDTAVVGSGHTNPGGLCTAAPTRATRANPRIMWLLALGLLVLVAGRRRLAVDVRACDGRQRDGRQRDGRQRDGRQRDGRQRDGRA